MFSFSFADLIRPDSGANLSYIYVPFEWEQEPNAISYNLQVSSQQSFDNIIVNIEESTTVYIEDRDLDWNDTYYWRVRSIYSNGDFGQWSQIFYFSIAGKQFPDINASISVQETSGLVNISFTSSLQPERYVGPEAEVTFTTLPMDESNRGRNASHTRFGP